MSAIEQQRQRRVLILWALATLLALALAGVAVAGGEALLLTPTDSDLIASRLATPEAKALPADLAREPVSFTWALPRTSRLDLSPTPYVASSKEYWVAVSAAELRAGTAIFTTAPGALVRIQPAEPSGKAAAAVTIDSAAVEVRDPRGASLAGESAFDLLVTADELAAAGAPFAEGTSAFRLQPRLGGGRFLLQVENLAAPDDARYVVHVFDRESPVALTLSPSRDAYLEGDRLTVHAALTTEGTVIANKQIEGFVAAPDGRVFDLAFHPSAGGSFSAELPLTARGSGGLWEVIASARGSHQGEVVLRSVRNVVALAVPTARLAGDAFVERPEGEKPLLIRVSVETAAAGRYELRGLLFGSGEGSELSPIAVAHAADWLAEGPGVLTLRFDHQLLDESGLTAPFELRDLRLYDQGRFGLLHRQEKALAF